MIRVVLPVHLRRMTNTGREITLDIEGEATFSAVLDTLETQYPMLRGTIRDYVSKERRAYIRYFACGEDYSHHNADTPLPEAVKNGTATLRIVGAMSGG